MKTPKHSLDDAPTAPVQAEAPEDDVYRESVLLCERKIAEVAALTRSPVDLARAACQPALAEAEAIAQAGREFLQRHGPTYQALYDAFRHFPRVADSSLTRLIADVGQLAHDTPALARAMERLPDEVRKRLAQLGGSERNEAQLGLDVQYVFAMVADRRTNPDRLADYRRDLESRLRDFRARAPAAVPLRVQHSPAFAEAEPTEMPAIIPFPSMPFPSM